MKTSTTVCVLGIALLVAGGLVHQSLKAQATGGGAKVVAVCDLAKIYTEYDRAKDNLAGLKERRQKIQDEVRKRGAEIEKIREALPGLVQGSDAYEAEFQKMISLQTMTPAWQKMQMQLAMRDHEVATQKMDEEVMAMVRKIAGQQGIDLVLTPDPRGEDPSADIVQKVNRRQILYYSDAVDITETVLKKLNQEYRNSEGN